MKCLIFKIILNLKPTFGLLQELKTFPISRLFLLAFFLNRQRLFTKKKLLKYKKLFNNLKSKAYFWAFFRSLTQ